MAKTAEQIAQQLIDSIESTNSTVDTSQGPIPDLFIRPQSGPIALASEETESLRQLFSLDFQVSATDAEVRGALANYGSTPGIGAKARHVQYFMKFTKPTINIEIPAGTLVSNIDGSLQYQVISTGKILSSSPGSFFNPSRNAYEIGLLVEAVGTGPEFDLPSFRVNTLITPINGIDSTENRAQSTGGLDAESKDQQSARLKKSLQGINLGSPGGIKNLIRNEYPELITDVAVIQPFEIEFSRIVSSPALDVYMIGQNIESFTQTYTATGGETQIPLTKVPALQIASVTINGSSGVVTSTLVPDTSFETGKSLKANDIIVFDTPLIANDQVIMQYSYNSVLETVSTGIFSTGEDLLFNTDILLRSAFQVNPKISGQVKALPSFTSTEVEQNILAFLVAEFDFTVFTSIVYPEVIRQRVITEVSGVQSFKLSVFRRATGALADVEPMVFARNEISVFDTAFINIKVVK